MRAAENEHHNDAMQLRYIANGVYERAYHATAVGFHGEMLNKQDALMRLVKMDHRHCPYCLPCPSHGY